MRLEHPIPHASDTVPPPTPAPLIGGGRYALVAKIDEGGMAAVCATEQYQERIAANPANRERLMGMDPKRYIEVMSRWLEIFTRGPVSPMLGVSEEALRSIRVPTVVIPGNDQTHSMTCGRAIQRLIPQSRLLELPLEDQHKKLVEDALENALLLQTSMQDDTRLPGETDTGEAAQAA